MTLRYGDHGDEVVSLQTLLQQKGFSLDTDGKYGAQTESAVKQYQTRHNLNADGIVNDTTWKMLTQGDTAHGDHPDVLPSTPDAAAYRKPTAAETVEALEAHPPAPYQSAYSTDIENWLQQVLDRDEFTYDMNADALYQQYRDQYTRLGERAMRDTIGQASALTGGYASSYAERAGQQAYQDYLTQLNDRVPELYAAALESYRVHRDAPMEALQALTARDETAYQRYLDTLDQYDANLAYYYKKLMNEAAEPWNGRYGMTGAGNASSVSSSDPSDAPDEIDESDELVTPSPSNSWPANILTEKEFNQRKARGAASLAAYDDYEAYVETMRRRYAP